MPVLVTPANSLLYEFLVVLAYKAPVEGIGAFLIADLANVVAVVHLYQFLVKVLGNRRVQPDLNADSPGIEIVADLAFCALIARALRAFMVAALLAKG